MNFVGFTDEAEARHDGNVFEAQPALDAATGGWRHPVRRALTFGIGVPVAGATAWWLRSHRRATTFAHRWRRP
jgi:hypothetical protein